jgi:DNA topoisomerase-1
MGTILDRGYVRKQGQALVPEFLAFAVVNLLERHFPQLVDYEFTARMEDDLDEIAAGEEARTEWLRRFYYGSDGDAGLKELVEQHLGDIDAREINTLPIPGSDIVVRVGRYGPYLERDGQRQTLPPDLAPDELTPERAEELLAQGRQERELGVDPETGHTVFVRAGRYGPYVSEAVEGEDKPRTASLFASMSPDTVTLDEALRLLTLPRTLGEVDGEPVVAANGRYGPYVKKGSETRSLESEEQLFTATLEDALTLLAAPKTRRRRAAAPPLKELGDDPASGKPIVVKEGRFGPYVTDGETNASLRGGDTIESVTPERARELLAERRQRGPAKRRRKAR